MPAIVRMDSALDVWFKRQMRDVHTSLRARVVSVDYGIPSATVQPLASTTFSDGTTDAYPSVFDVPLQMASGNNGKARLTMPIKAGDIVGLTFSERNEGSTGDKTTHGMFAGWAVTSIHSDGNAMPIDPNNVELWNDKVNISMTPEGDFTVKGPVGTLKVDKTGQMTFTNGPASFTAKTDGTIEMNGAKVTPDGNFITSKGVNMNDFYDFFMRHTHHYTWTDGSGQGDTKEPNK